MSDVEQWLLKRRTANEPQIEPVEDLGSHVRLFSHMDEKNIFLDVPDSEAATLIRNAIHRAELSLSESPEQAANRRRRESGVSTFSRSGLQGQVAGVSPGRFPSPHRDKRGHVRGYAGYGSEADGKGDWGCAGRRPA